jgi:hypothetical protein
VTPGQALDELRQRAGMTWDDLEDSAARSTVARALSDGGTRLSTWLSLLKAAGVSEVVLHGPGEPVRIPTHVRRGGANNPSE